MATVFDVAVYILQRCGDLSAMKLQKLVYYAQAWSLVWDDEPLFPDNIEAWANGPVVRTLYMAHKGSFKVTTEMIKGDPSNLTDEQIETLNAVCDAYCNRTAQELSDMTHSEAPWQKARQGLAGGERGDRVISLESMAEFYSSLQ